jgi:hypothetical protein
MRGGRGERIGIVSYRSGHGVIRCGPGFCQRQPLHQPTAGGPFSQEACHSAMTVASTLYSLRGLRAPSALSAYPLDSRAQGEVRSRHGYLS